MKLHPFLFPLISLVLVGCGQLGTCYIGCIQPTSQGDVASDVGPYYDTSRGWCADEAHRLTTEELASWDVVCEADWVAY